MPPTSNNLILYNDAEGKVSVNVRFAEEDVWLTNNLIAELYATSRQLVDYHINNIYSDGELLQEATCKDFLLVRKEGNRNVERSLPHYNLDVIIAIGYRVQSPVAVRFRRWATQRLHEYIQKGFALDDERLKQDGNRYFKAVKQLSLNQNDNNGNVLPPNI